MSFKSIVSAGGKPKKLKLTDQHRKTHRTIPVKVQKKNHFPDRILTDMRRFYFATDWRELWEDFYLGIDSDGRPKYRTLHQFVEDKAESPTQIAFMMEHLGPKNDSDEPLRWTFAGAPQDWSKKRADGGWAAQHTTREAFQNIKHSTNVLQKIAQVGDRVHLSMVERWDNLVQKLLEQSKGVLFLPDLSYKENVARAHDIINLMSRCQEGLKGATDAYMRSQGVNMDDIQGLVALMASPLVSSTARALEAQGGLDKGIDPVTLQLTKMVMGKVARFKLPMTNDMEDKIVETVAEPVAPPTKKKSEIN